MSYTGKTLILIYHKDFTVETINIQLPKDLFSDASSVEIVRLKGTPPIKKIDFFRALPEKGGGRALPEFFYPFFHHVVPYILTSISCYVILFGHF